MDKKSDLPVSEMDDRGLLIHAMGLVYRDAERRCEEAMQQTEKANREIQEMEDQMKEMAEAYKILMQRNAELTSQLHKQQEELELLRKSVPEKRTEEKGQERGKDA